MNTACKFLKKIYFFVFFFFLVFLKNSYGIGSLDPEWKVIKTLHFDILHSDETIDIAIQCAKMAEESYVYIANKLHHELNYTVEIILFASELDYIKNRFLSSTGLYPASRYPDLYNSHINLFFHGSYNEMHKELTHELVHSFQYDILFANSQGWDYSFTSLSDYPEFIIEGMAEYLSSGYDEYADIFIHDIVRSGSFPDIEKRFSESSSKHELCSEMRKSFFYFLETIFGEDIFGDLMRDLKVYDLNKAIEFSTMTDMEEIKAKWINFYKERYYSYTKNISLPDDEENITWIRINTPGPNLSLRSQDNENIYHLNASDNRFVVSRINLSSNESEIMLRYSTKYNISGLYDFAYFDNYPSISLDKNIAAFVKRDKRDIIILADMQGRIIKEIKLPFKRIKDLCISADGGLLAFAGVSNSSTDIYIYNIANKSITRITDDLYSERFPKISRDNTFVVFCSNANDANDLEWNDYKLIRFDLDSNTRSVLVHDNNNLHPEISPDCRKILYVSNTAGIYNAYYYDTETGENIQITDYSGGVFFPCWIPGENKIIFTSYNDSAYNIYLKETDNINIAQGKGREIEYAGIDYPASYFDTSHSVLLDYDDESNEDAFFCGSAAVSDFALLGSANMFVTDTLNKHELGLETGFQRIYEKDYANINLEYDYLGYRTDFGFGLFYRSNPVNPVYNPYNRSLNEYLIDFNTGHYGLYGLVNFPLLKGFSTGLRGYSSIYEHIDQFNINKEDEIYSNKLSVSFNYDNIIHDKGYPIKGAKYELEIGNSFNMSGTSIYRTIDFDFFNIFSFWKIFLSIKGNGGKIFGQDKDKFAYFIGGLDSIRGHRFFEYRGRNAFLINTEIGMVLFKRINIYWPFIMSLNDLSFVLFLDTGSAWDEDFTLMNPDTGELEDLKAGAGAGLRFILCDHSLFKLDFAWPYFYRSFGSSEVIFGFEFRF